LIVPETEHRWLNVCLRKEAEAATAGGTGS
jgi:hypothetical protein